MMSQKSGVSYTGRNHHICITILLHGNNTRSFAKPPLQVQTVCECIVIFKGFKEVNWKTAKGMMSETNFLSSLQKMDVDGISPSQVCFTSIRLCQIICVYIHMSRISVALPVLVQPIF